MSVRHSVRDPAPHQDGQDGSDLHQLSFQGNRHHSRPQVQRFEAQLLHDGSQVGQPAQLTQHDLQRHCHHCRTSHMPRGDQRVSAAAAAASSVFPCSPSSQNHSHAPHLEICCFISNPSNLLGLHGCHGVRPCHRQQVTPSSFSTLSPDETISRWEAEACERGPPVPPPPTVASSRLSTGPSPSPSARGSTAP